MNAASNQEERFKARGYGASGTGERATEEIADGHKERRLSLLPDTPKRN
jgi:hypothetical protein